MKLSQPAFAANTSITYVKNVKKKKKEEQKNIQTTKKLNKNRK